MSLTLKMGNLSRISTPLAPGYVGHNLFNKKKNKPKVVSRTTSPLSLRRTDEATGFFMISPNPQICIKSYEYYTAECEG